jgi:hypothetical protein
MERKRRVIDEVVVRIIYCHVYGVRVTKRVGYSSDDWIY